eukprot:scaffold10378_cov111-Isochrysis_galbana.AAC.4
MEINNGNGMHAKLMSRCYNDGSRKAPGRLERLRTPRSRGANSSTSDSAASTPPLIKPAHKTRRTHRWERSSATLSPPASPPQRARIRTRPARPLSTLAAPRRPAAQSGSSGAAISMRRPPGSQRRAGGRGRTDGDEHKLAARLGVGHAIVLRPGVGRFDAVEPLGCRQREDAQVAHLPAVKRGSRLGLAHRYARAGGGKQRDAVERRRQADGLAALVVRSLVVIVPPAPPVERQVDVPPPAPLLHHVRHQQRRPAHEIIGGQPGVRVLLKVVKGGAERRLVGVARRAEQLVKVRHQRVSELDRRQDGGDGVRVHPGRGDRAVGVPRVDGEARVEDAVLQPAHQQLGRGRRAGEAAHIVPKVEAAGERQAEAHLQVEPQGFPAGVIVARPRLHVPA